MEVKNSAIGDGTKISHLTYVGDSDVGRKVNFGCGTVTTNYDGVKKYRCTIEDGAFIGVLSGPAIDRINDSVITELALLDTIPAIDPKKSSKIKYLQVAPMFAEAIERIYQEISISKLFR